MLVPNCQHVLVCFLVVVFLFLPHDIAPISVAYLLCCPTSSFETLSLSPSCPAPPWKWCHSSHEKGDNGHNGPPLPEVPGSQTMWGKVWSKLRKDLHPCLQNRVSCLLVKKVTWKHTLACWLAFLASHKEARTFHKSLQEVKYARLLGRQGKRRTHVLSN